MKNIVILSLLLFIASTACQDPITKLEIELIPNTNEDGLTKSFDVRFINRGNTRIGIIRPMDGSYYNLIYPNYNVVIIDSLGNEVEKIGRCGNYGTPFSGTSYPKDYYFEIKPKRTLERPLSIDHLKMEDQKEYSIKLEYINVNDDPIIENIWTGEVTTPFQKFRFKDYKM